MAVPSSSVNMERLNDGNVEMDIYVRKWDLLLVLNRTKQTIKQNKENNVK